MKTLIFLFYFSLPLYAQIGYVTVCEKYLDDGTIINENKVFETNIIEFFFDTYTGENWNQTYIYCHIKDADGNLVVKKEGEAPPDCIGVLSNAKLPKGTFIITFYDKNMNELGNSGYFIIK
jgi:hypothetical protein